MSYLYHLLISTPLYNGLILLMDASPWIDAGVAVIILTLFVKLILAPLTKKSVVTQLKMKQIEKDLAQIRDKFKNDKQAQAMETMALYKKAGVNPFSGILLVLIQLPIIFALYAIFLKSGLPVVNTELLYPFVKVPSVNMEFLGFINIAAKNIYLAILAAVVQFFQIRLSMPATPKSENKTPSFQEDLARNLNTQMRYVFPVMLFFIAYSTSATVALYLIVSSLFTIGQELWIRKHTIS
jgi:YidC/Oxa1 family membrane protein insertase